MLLDLGPDEITLLMAGFRAGDNQAGGTLIGLFYPDLKRLAAGPFNREREEHGGQSALLVNELYLELIKIKALPTSDRDRKDEKPAFFALAGQITTFGRNRHRRRIEHSGSRVARAASSGTAL